MKNFIFTPENLLNNLYRLGAWSSYGLACEALKYYFPDYKDKAEKHEQDIKLEVELLESLGCFDWQGLIIKYHKEIGYKRELLSNKEMVNEY